LDSTTPSILSDIDCAAIVKDLAPRCRVFMVGPHCSAEPEDTLRRANGVVDAVAIGEYDYTVRDLVRNALRMRPDRIVVGEVRGGEVLDMLQAMNTGHEGSMTTIHANSPRDSLTRLENMVGMAGMNLPTKAMRHQVSSALAVIVQIARLTDGRRKIVSIQELTGMEGEIITMQELFAFRQTGVDDNGTVAGYFCATGVRPHFTDRVRSYGIDLPDSLFDPARRYE